MLSDLPPVPDTDCSLYEEDDYIGKIDTLDIHIVYTTKTNKFAGNPRNSINYDT